MNKLSSHIYLPMIIGLVFSHGFAEGLSGNHKIPLTNEVLLSAVAGLVSLAGISGVACNYYTRETDNDLMRFRASARACDSAIPGVDKADRVNVRKRFMEFFNDQKEMTKGQDPELKRKIEAIERKKGFFDQLTDSQINQTLDDIDNISTRGLNQSGKIRLITSHGIHGIKGTPTPGAINFMGDDFVTSLFKHIAG